MSRIYKLYTGKHIIVRAQILPNDPTTIRHHECNGWFLDRVYTTQIAGSQHEEVIMLSVYDPQTEITLKPDIKMEELLIGINKEASVEVQSVG